jgi:signal transduction histidine kinase
MGRAAAIRGWWRRVGTVRLKTTLAAVGAVSVALLIAAIGVLSWVRSDAATRLLKQVEATVHEAAAQLAGEPAAGNFVVQGSGVFEFPPPILQAIDEETGVVVAMGLVVPGGEPGAVLNVSPASLVARVQGRIIDLPSEEWVVGTERIKLAGRSVIVAAASPRFAIERDTAAVTRSLAIGFPALAATVGVLTWILVGRALGPVERIRSEVEEITARTLDRRVAEPETTDEVGRLARTMNRMLGRLETSARRQREFVSDASHELRSPLSSVRAELEVALRSPNGAAWPEVAAGVLEEHARLERLVEDLLALARSDESRYGPTAEVDLDHVVHQETRRLRDAPIDTRDVAPVRLQGSARDLARLVGNLLENAARHARRRIAVELSHMDGVAVLAVEDDGPGIPPEDRDRVFERFTRLDEGRTRDSGGVGLGLALVRSIAHHHGGTVHVEEGASHGARFVVSLPMAAASAPDRPRDEMPSQDISLF